jgi:hypothetical protein
MIIFFVYALISGCTGKNDGTYVDLYVVIEEIRQKNAQVVEGQLYQYPFPFMNDVTPVPIFPIMRGNMESPLMAVSAFCISAITRCTGRIVTLPLSRASMDSLISLSPALSS